jgi:hypothetical protein
MDEPERKRVVGELLRAVDFINDADYHDGSEVTIDWLLADRIREAMNGAILLLRQEAKP